VHVRVLYGEVKISWHNHRALPTSCPYASIHDLPVRVILTREKGVGWGGVGGEERERESCVGSNNPRSLPSSHFLGDFGKVLLGLVV
jgi:hypothetical protein